MKQSEKIAAACTAVRSRERSIYIVTGIGSIVNLGLFIFKLIAGIVGQSSAMVADAVHSLSDFITDIIVVVFVRLSSKPADLSHSYGHGKFETLATLIIAITMFLVGLGILYNAIEKITLVARGEILHSPGMIALWAAIISIVSKEILFRYTRAKGKQFDSSAVIANAWHHRSDAMSSVCTALGIGGAIFLGGKWAILDPIAAGIVSIFIIRVGLQTARPSLEDLLERSLPTTVRNDIMETIISVPGVGEPHHLLTRRIGTSYAIEFNLHLPESVSLKEACSHSEALVDALKKRYGQNTHVGIHFKLKNAESTAHNHNKT